MDSTGLSIGSTYPYVRSVFGDFIPKTKMPEWRRKDFMAKQDDKFTMDAIVVEALPNAMFKVRLPNEQQSEIIGYVSGKMRKHYIRILPGDTVTVEISPYDLTKARITYRR